MPWKLDPAAGWARSHADFEDGKSAGDLEGRREELRKFFHAQVSVEDAAQGGAKAEQKM